jgi:hypothetical protein
MLTRMPPEGAAPRAAGPVVERPEEPPATAPEDSGVDLSLIRWMLSLSPAERLASLQGFVDSIAALRHGRDA